MYGFEPHVCSVGRHQTRVLDLLGLELIELRDSMWILGIKPIFSEKPVVTLKPGIIPIPIAPLNVLF